MADNVIKELVIKVLANAKGAKDTLDNIKKTARQTEKELKNVGENSKKASLGIEKLTSGFKMFASALSLVAGAFGVFKMAQQRAQDAVSRNNFSEQFKVEQKEVKALGDVYESYKYKAEDAMSVISKVQDQLSKSRLGKGTDPLAGLIMRAMGTKDAYDRSISPVLKLQQAMQQLIKEQGGDVNKAFDKATQTYGLSPKDAHVLLSKNFNSQLEQARLNANRTDDKDKKLIKIADAMQRVDKATERLATTLSARLAPALADFMDATADSVDRLDRMLDGTEQIAPDMWDGADAVDDLSKELEGISKWWADFTGSTEEADNQMTEFTKDVKDGIKQFAELDAVKPIIKGFGTFFSEIFRGVNDVWDKFAGNFKGFWEWFRKKQSSGYKDLNGKQLEGEIFNITDENGNNKAVNLDKLEWGNKVRKYAPKAQASVPASGNSSFERAVSTLLKDEGGYVNDKDDRGGETKYGISKRAHPNVDIKNLTKEQAKEIYKKQYWDAIKADQIPEHMRYAVFDASVNQGQGTALSWYRQSGGDLEKFNSLREAHYRSLARDPTQRKFLRGWLNRSGMRSSGTRLAHYDRPSFANVARNSGIYINKVDVHANNVEQLARGIKDVASKQGQGLAHQIQMGKTANRSTRV